eukprot:SAG31_NODE_1927_length_6884_cov_2.706264_2_plen_200_part_00
MCHNTANYGRRGSVNIEAATIQASKGEGIWATKAANLVKRLGVSLETACVLSFLHTTHCLLHVRYHVCCFHHFRSAFLDMVHGNRAAALAETGGHAGLAYGHIEYGSDGSMHSMDDPEGIEALFNAGDEDGSGMLDARELGTLMHQLTGKPLSDEEMQGTIFSSFCMKQKEEGFCTIYVSIILNIDVRRSGARRDGHRW